LLKRTFDFTLALVALIALMPIMGLIAVAIHVFREEPCIFRQRRIGAGGKEFTVLKFRTMSEDRDENGMLLPDAERLTRLGRFLRRTSLDELPQFWNVLRGDMSIVGPRPLLPEYLLRYNNFQRRRHEIRPGITGWAQVNGRNGLTWEERFELDVWYVDHRNMMLDLRILWLTVGIVARRQGIQQLGCATMPPFMGSGQEARNA
jgi:sugar transferase EpsL